MTTGRMQHTIKRFREALRQHESHAEHALNAAHKQAVQAINQRLSHLYQEMERAMADGEPLPASWLYEQNRLQNALKVVEGQMDHYGAMSQVTTQQMQRVGVRLGQQAADVLLQSTVPSGISYAFGVPDARAIANIVGATQDGSPLSALFDGFGQEAAQKVKTALIQGITLGDNPRAVARDVQEALDISRQRALVISRQEMLRAYKSANIATYQENADILDGWIWQASMGTACAMCSAMNGEEFPVSEEMESHICCRCVPIPKTKPWSEILGNAEIEDFEIEDASIDVQSGPDWFDEQPEEVQRQILGPSKYAAYSDGAITLQDLVGVSHSDEWGTSRYEKSLKEILGSKKAMHYYPRKR